jgi:hypothetical protein
MTSLASDIIRAKALDLLVENAELVPETSESEDQGAEG